MTLGPFFGWCCMKIAIAQIATIAGDFEVTARRMLEYARRADAEGCDLVVFPYASFTGTQEIDEGDYDAYLYDASETLAHFATELPCAAIVPVVREVSGDIRSEAFLLDNGDATPLRMSAFASSLSALRQQKSFPSPDEMPAPDLPEFEFRGHRCGLAFTVDNLDDYRDFDFDIDVLFYLPSDSYVKDDPDTLCAAALDRSRYRNDAIQTSSWLVCANSLGGYGDNIFIGGSFVLDPEGSLVKSGPVLEEALITCDLEGSEKVQEIEPSLPNGPEERRLLWGALARGLADLVREGSADGVALMLDGSLPSSLLCALACDAVGPMKVMALLVTDDPATLELARRLHIEWRTPDFRMPVPQPGAWAQDSPELERSIQEAFLQELARQSSSLVLVDDDKTGLALGESRSCIRYAWAPFGDIFRSELIGLAEARNEVSPVIPEAILRRFEVPEIFGIEHVAPTPRKQLACLDALLARRIDQFCTYNETMQLVMDPDFKKAVLHRLYDALPRRMVLPLFFVVSLRTIDEMKSPLGNVWMDHEREAEDAPSFGEMMERLKQGLEEGAGRSAAGEIPPAADQQALRDAFELIREMSAGSSDKQQDEEGQEPEEGGFSLKPGFPSWENPFSEN